MSRPLVLVGGGGHCRSCIEVIESVSNMEIHGVIDLPESVGLKILGYKVVGCDDDIALLAAMNTFEFLVTVGQIQCPQKRKQLFEQILSVNGKLSIIQASSAVVSKYAIVNAGTIVMHNSFVNANVDIGSNVIINTGCIIEHDVTIGNHCHISTNSVVNGNVEIGDECFIGSGAVVSNGVKIVNKTIIGAGTIVIDDITTPGTYVGNPARKLG